MARTAVSKIEDIKDKTPNPNVIRQIEKMLEDAKAGNIRSLVTIAGWDDDSWTHAWALDRRNTRLRMIGQIATLQHEALTNEALFDKDSVLSQALD